MLPWIVTAVVLLLALLLFFVMRRKRPSGKPRPLSLALALIFAQVLDPPTRHVIEAKQPKRDAAPRPGDPPPDEL